MTKDQAINLVNAYLAKIQKGRSYEISIVHDQTLEEDFGWVFFYNTKQYIESGDIEWALGGNAPLIVDRDSGALHVTGTALSIDEYIRDFRRTRR